MQVFSWQGGEAQEVRVQVCGVRLGQALHRLQGTVCPRCRSPKYTVMTTYMCKILRKAQVVKKCIYFEHIKVEIILILGLPNKDHFKPISFKLLWEAVYHK